MTQFTHDTAPYPSGLDMIGVVGHSMGGLVAQEVALPS
jgi:pimeloyl-ACP methyl ester carboxylesterase